MKKFEKEKKSILLKAYLWTLFVVILISLLNMGYYFFTKNNILVLSADALFYLSMAIFIFSVYCLTRFLKEKLHTITLVLPIWITVKWILLIALTMFLFRPSSAIILEEFMSLPMVTLLSLVNDVLQFGLVCYTLFLVYQDSLKIS